jgi:hypothetical protein
LAATPSNQISFPRHLLQPAADHPPALLQPLAAKLILPRGEERLVLGHAEWSGRP